MLTRISSLLALSLAGIAATFAALALNAGLLAVTPAPARAASDVVVYADALATGWENWSWNTTLNLDNASPVHGGARSIAISYSAGWAGLSLYVPSPINPADHPTLTFWIHGGSAPAKLLTLSVHTTGSGGQTGDYAITAQPGVWMPVTVTMSQLGNPSQIARINVQDRTGGLQGTFYIDDIRFVAGVPQPPPPAPAGFTATIRIQAAGPYTSVDSRILGTNLPAWLGPGNFSNATFRARTAASGISVLRLPGGSWSNAYGWLSCERGAYQPGAEPCGDNWASWAARPTDFASFLRATGKQGMWVVNPNGTAKEAAAVVAFFNGAVTDARVIGVDIRGTDWYTVGRWAQLRVAGGNVQPLGIKLWEFGNEVYGGKPAAGGSLCLDWGWEDVWTCDGTEYVNGRGSGASRHEGYLEFRAAMRAVDPTIQVGAVGFEYPGNPSSPDWSNFNNWGIKVISAAGANLDFYSIHPYAYFELPANTAAGWAEILAEPNRHWRDLKAGLSAAFGAYAGGRQAPIAATEFNLVSVQDQDNNQFMTRMVNALFLADSIGQAIRHGYAMLNQWDLANGRPPNGTEYGLMHVDNGFYRAPQYYAYPLWARFGSQMLAVTSTADAASQVSAYAGRVNSATVSLLAINKTGAPVTTTISVAGFGPLIGGSAYEVRAASLLSQAVMYNGTSNPSDGLSEPPASFSVVGNAVTRVLAPYSITLLHLRQAPPNVGPRVYLPIVIR